MLPLDLDMDVENSRRIVAATNNNEEVSICRTLQPPPEPIRALDAILRSRLIAH
jgi:hypothetical protein